MIIRGVKLLNVLSHESTELAFPNGVVSIVGPNGAGKSSIVDAVYVALLSDAKPDIRGGKKEFVVMRGKTRGKISVLLEVGGRTYLVEREMDVFGSTQAHLYEVDGELRRLRATGVSNVVKEVGRLLGLPTYTAGELRRLVRATIFSLQGELTQIIDIESSERKKWVLSLLGLTYLERALDSIKGVVREERDRLKGEFDSKVRSLRDDKASLERLKKELGEVEVRLRDLSKEKERVDRIVRALEERLELVNTASDMALELRAALVLRRLREVEEEIRRLGALRDWSPDTYSRLARDVSDKRRHFQKVEEQLARFLESVTRTAGVSAEKLEELYGEIERSINDLIEQRGRHEERARLYRELLAKLELSDRCPICGSAIADPEGVRRRIAEEALRAEKVLEALRSELKDLSERRQIIDKVIRSLSELASERERVERDLREREEELRRLRDRAVEICRLVGIDFRDADECATALNTRREELNRAEAELEVLKRYAQGTTRDVAMLRPEELKQRLRDALDTLGVRPASDASPEMIDGLIRELGELRRRVESELRDARRELDRLSNEMSGLRGRVEELRRHIREKEEAVMRLEAEVLNLKRKIEALDTIERFSASYLGKDGEIAKSLTRVVRSNLEARANRILDRLGLPSIRIDDEFQISIRVPGGEVPIDNASGGERVGISIALRLALAELVMGRSPTTLILDEPTIYLDDERRELVFDIVRQLGRSLRQLVVVTHDDAVVKISDKVINVENIGGVSRVGTPQEASGEPVGGAH